MQRTAAGLRTDSSARIDQLARQRPEWRTWLDLLGETARALDDPGWRTPLADAVERREDAPLLHQRTLRVDGGRVRRLVRRLASAAGGTLRRYAPSDHESVALVEAAVCQDSAALAALAASAGVDVGALSPVVQLAAIPLLSSWGRALASQVPRGWPRGYCPVCAAWPIIAERRGLDRTRQLRCGRCACEWEIEWLRCVYCGERDHRRLGSLIPDADGEILKVETCETCRGYLKSVATLQRLPGLELLLRDLETVELDLVAIERGYGRPEASGFMLQVRLG